ncbi:hypothetical protein TetV_048 [Tetraselmis virus 1]|uniref:Lipoprotein n=1 Tax=Tetraselmis virus 1 TaxID=2060617 RepID=A0A2P0VMN3_9VIRU|nr:hypothetical protein QJ968_gp048 [Tetraselmis virus 1]AUF82140.1 hypothetical protein TetV_048 [Tetraselmis virus 1]
MTDDKNCIITIMTVGVLTAFMLFALGCGKQTVEPMMTGSCGSKRKCLEYNEVPSAGVCTVVIQVNKLEDRSPNVWMASWHDPKSGINSYKTAKTKKDLAYKTLISMRAYETKRNACLIENINKFGLSEKEKKEVFDRLFDTYGAEKKVSVNL